MKRDVVAAIVFLTTGFLFYLVETGRAFNEGFAPQETCTQVEAMVIGENAVEKGDSPFLLQEIDSRDG